MSISVVLLGVGLVAAALQGSITSALKLSSPCPGLFHYDSADQPNQWSGTVTLLSDYELHGVWIRLLFDEKLTGLDVHDNFGEVVPKDEKEYLVKNRDVLLQPGTPTDFKITVKYEGDKVPTLTGYRLNAKMVCSVHTGSPGQFFSGDLNNKDFLASITSQQQEPSAYKEFEGCGTAPLSADREPANEGAQNGQWPWQGAIYVQNNEEEKYVCGATLVSSRHVLTPAHCVTYQKSELTVPVSQVKVHLGKGEDKNVQELGVEKIFLHPGYRAKQLLNDLSIIQLDKPVIIGDYVRPICLKQQANKVEGFLLGYAIKGDQIQDLTQAKIDTINEEHCLQKNPNLKSLLTDNVACARYTEDNGPCVGDSGSSFISARDGAKPVWELKGVVTVGTALQNKNACDPSSRVLLVEVANYLKWIQGIIS